MGTEGDRGGQLWGEGPGVALGRAGFGGAGVRGGCRAEGARG